MKRVVAAIRDGWLILGVVVGLCVSLELLYRTQGAIRRGVAAVLSDPPRPTVLDTAHWFSEYERERVQSFALRWEPYVYHRRVPHSGTYINVDSAGHRATVQAPTSSRARKVFFFGGSTMFGSFQRDGWTIPSVAARTLDSLGVEDVHVVNYGETGYVSTQEAVALWLALRDGERPDVVVFYDGINDVAAAVQTGRAGWPQNEFNRAREFQLGRTVYHWQRGPGSEVRAFTALLGIAVGRSLLVQRVLAMKGSPPPVWDASALANDVMQSYAATTRLVEALAERFDFRAVFVWQPTVHATAKALSPYEANLRRTLEEDPASQLMATVHLRIVERIDSVMSDQGSPAFLNRSHVFDGIADQIFVDAIGHTVEAANPLIVASLMPALLAGLQSATSHPGGS